MSTLKWIWFSLLALLGVGAAITLGKKKAHPGVLRAKWKANQARQAVLEKRISAEAKKAAAEDDFENARTHIDRAEVLNLEVEKTRVRNERLLRAAEQRRQGMSDDDLARYDNAAVAAQPKPS